MNFADNFKVFLEALKLMAFGMGGIFLVLLIIFLSIKLLLWAFPPKKN